MIEKPRFEAGSSATGSINDQRSTINDTGTPIAPSRRVACEIRIGTSGWHYAHWKGRFYPEKAPPAEMFRIYLEHFDTVEINNTFYHLPPLSAFENWKKIAPPGFLYALKGSRFLTHMKKLREPDEGIARFFEGARLLGRKLGPIVFQLPPRWRVNLERLET
ncbi:MAG TPA: DUF72 domain-containing protein, partial [Thermoanaerobaculia bacterium]|nr:DUF72 domain-containing protein [Thermoanaerobaculia bacterium]